MRYQAVALQLGCQAVNAMELTEARQKINANIERMGKQVGGSKAFIGSDTRLVVLPEYLLTGFPFGESIAAWKAMAAIDPDGAEYDAMAAIAQKHDVFLAGNAYETDPHFPDYYFQTCFVIDPAGNLVLRYRRLISMFAPSPHDIWDQYLDVYGIDAVFPVADTQIGRLGAIASEEILYPEIARAHALKGAEVLVHSSSEAGSPLPTNKVIAKQARALENLAYVVSANTANIVGTAIPDDSAAGRSMIMDYRGFIMAQAAGGESMTANAQIDIEAVRAYRRRPGMGNLLARQRPQMYQSVYESDQFQNANALLGEDRQVQTPDRGHFQRQQDQVLERLAKARLI